MLLRLVLPELWPASEILSCKAHAEAVQTVLDRLHEELSGERIVRATVRTRVAHWLETKKHEVAPATLYFYQNSLGKFIDFLGPRADLPMTEVSQARHPYFP